MKLFSDFTKGFVNCFKGFTILFEKGLWPFIFLPLIAWLLLFIASIYSAISLSDYITNSLSQYFNSESSVSDSAWVAFIKPKLTGTFSFLLKWIIKLLFWFVGSVISKYILLTILSPVFSLLSELTEERLTSNKFPFNIIQLLKDIIRGALINLRNLFLELLSGFVLWFLALLFPPLALITIPLGLIIGWYFTGFSIMDYSCERNKLSVTKGIQFIRSNSGYAIGIGCVYALFQVLPTIAGDIIGIMFGPTIAVVGATISFLEIRDSNNN